MSTATATTVPSTSVWLEILDEIGPEFAQRAATHDEGDLFVRENLEELRRRGFFSAAVPAEMGGGGAGYRQMCEVLRALAHYCPSTALTFSMHTHVIAAQVWNDCHGKPGRKLLERVAAENIMMVSTGGRDWLDSNGTATKVDGGFRISAQKFFASGSPMADLMATSAPYEDPEEGWQVLHFAVPFTAEGVSIRETWKAMGMRGTGSHTIVLDEVFVADEAIALRRPQSEFHPLWNVVLGVALPLITSVYVGVAEAAAEHAFSLGAGRKTDPVMPMLLGELRNCLTSAQLAVDSMVDIADGYDFDPVVEVADDIVVRKSLALNAVLATVEKALEATGGSGFFRSSGLERMVRDAHAGQFHPMPEKRQQLFSGRLAMGLDPIG